MISCAQTISSELRTGEPASLQSFTASLPWLPVRYKAATRRKHAADSSSAASQRSAESRQRAALAEFGFLAMLLRTLVDAITEDSRVMSWAMPPGASESLRRRACKTPANRMSHFQQLDYFFNSCMHHTKALHELGHVMVAIMFMQEAEEQADRRSTSASHARQCTLADGVAELLQTAAIHGALAVPH